MPFPHPLSVWGAALRRCHTKTDGARYNGPRGGVLHGHSRLRSQPRANQKSSRGSQRKMTKPSPKEIKAIADVAGVPVSAEIAGRIADSIGPAFEGFAAVAGTLPFDLEPATFLLAQTAKVTK